jgi:hypothetical protein
MKRLFNFFGTMTRRKLVESSYFRWFLFTAFFGVMPLTVRIITALLQPELQLPYIVFSDVVILGIIFHASTMANISANRWRPNILSVFGTVSVVSAVFLSFMYLISSVAPSLGEMCPILMTCFWVTAWISTGFAIFMSFASSDVAELDAGEYMIDLTEMLRRAPKEEQRRVFKVLDAWYKERGAVVYVEVINLFRRYGTAWLGDEEESKRVREALRRENPLQAYLDDAVARGEHLK